MNRRLEEAVAHFDKIARAEIRDWGDLHWCGEVLNCDVCSRPMGDQRYMIDGPASLRSDAPWGILCVMCAFKYSPRIGWGRAQLYKRSADGLWKLISGGSPQGSDDFE
jgi:hypothetical protein